MKNKELKFGDIIVVDHSWCPSGIAGKMRPCVHYGVLYNESGRKVAVAFEGNANCDDRPSGWYDLGDDEKDIPTDTVLVARPNFYGVMFSGDYDSPRYKILLDKRK